MDQMTDHRYDFVTFDRCIFDAYHWMLHWFEKDKLSEEEMRTHQNHFLGTQWTSQVGLAYIMICDPEVARQRKYEKASSKNSGKTTNPKSQKEITERFVRVYNELSPHYSQLRLIDTTTKSIKDVSEIVQKDVLEMCSKIVRQTQVI